ncbi:MAG: 4-vinyl reductase [Candidatus Aenigmarchaeota archaeon]|nr:4-vinyl reductase [Candidatus Aenigmarchaeota archaeon]
MISVFLSKLLTSRQASFTEENINIFDLLFVMQPVESLVELQREIEKSKKRSKVIINFGRKISELILKHFKTRFGMEKEELKSIWLNMFSLSGFGKLEVVKISSNSATFRIDSSTIAKIYLRRYGKQKKSVCSIISGMLESYVEEITGKLAKCRELNCLAKGEKYCIFEVSF